MKFQKIDFICTYQITKIYSNVVQENNYDRAESKKVTKKLGKPRIASLCVNTEKGYRKGN